MAGYDGYSKSNNAVQAEREGKMTATTLAEVLSVDAQAIREHCHPVEWHHASGRYNKTYYYDEPELIAGDNPELLATMKTDVAKRKTEGWETLEGVTVEWLEWSGTRNHPTCTERKATDCQVRYREGRAMVDIVMADGSQIRKKVGSNGLYFNSSVNLQEIVS